LIEKLLTKDGTATLYSKEFNESYHSLSDGALKESLEKHIIPAFKFSKKKDELNILDICFGLGYNSLSTLYYIKKNNLNIKINIISPEFDRELIKSLKSFEYPEEFGEFRDIIESLSSNLYYEDNQFRIEIFNEDARETIKNIDKKIDILYQDPFSPKKNPLLWTREYFKDIRAIASKDIVITTYSVATPIRLSMYENGFNIYKYQGEGVRGSTIASLKDLDLERVDIEHKKAVNREARSLRDIDFS
jgi:tRNA U34 5-methylaminomethyl-2-thiouridine-forming methyltransferase MnmC